jgi:2-(1,2-epoxy-1,2-dihydrophenyl)acetyl-CoA isomerase
MSDAIKVTRDGAITLIEMTQPKSRNALSELLRNAMRDAVADLSRDTDLRAVVLTGSEGVFCAGGDLKAMLARRTSGEPDGAEDRLDRMTHLHGWIRQLRDLPVPVITAVDGPAYGAGLGLALAGDMILASDRATFNASFCKVGAVPDGNLFYSLPRMVGLQRAKEMFYTGRIVAASEAREIGIAMEVLSPEALLPRAMEMARMMCDSSPLAFGLTKKITGRAMELDSEALLALEAQAQAICLTSRYHLDTLTRFTEKQPPLFDFK